MLGQEMNSVPLSDDPVNDVELLAPVLRRFCLEYPVLARVMFSRPFADFDPGDDELSAGASVRENVIDRIRRCVDEGLLAGDPTDIAHVLLALAQGLAIQEAGGWLGKSEAAVNRRWTVGVRAVLGGFAH